MAVVKGPQKPPVDAARPAGVPEELQFRSVAEAMPQLVWVADASGNIEYFNERWVSYTGLGVGDMPLADGALVHPEEADEVRERWNAAVATGEPYECEYRLRSRDGSYRWFVARAMPVLDDDGRVARWIGSATDIDAQRRAHDNLQFVIEASSRFSVTYGVSEICDTLAHLAVERVADWCFIVLRNELKDTYYVASIAHRDPAMVDYITQFRDRYPVRGGSATDMAVRKNISILTPSISDDEIRLAAQDEQHLEILRTLHMRSAMTLPLTGESGTVYGAIVLLSAESARQFTQSDLDVVERVAKRAGMAIETATHVQEERMRSQRLRFIARASELVFESIDVQESFDDLCKLIAAEMADFALILRFEQDGALRTVACAPRDPANEPLAARLRGERMLRRRSEELAERQLSQHTTILNPDVNIEEMLGHTWEYLAPDLRKLDVRSSITVPLYARGETFGALVAYWCSPGRRYTDADVPIFEDLGRRLSVAIERTAAFERERRIADELQRALLPLEQQFPNVPGLAFDAKYRASSLESDVGGDWFDAFVRQDGSICVCVGDVTGRGLNAAGLMGKLRQSIGIAAIYEDDPARILDTVDAHLRSRRSGAIATAFLGIIHPAQRSMRFATAGHPPPLLRRGAELLEVRAEGLPLGLRDFARAESTEISLEGADLLVLFTDGLLEATRDYAFGEKRVQDVSRSEAVLYVRNPARLICDACLPRDVQDDTAVLTVRFGERAQWQFDAENAEAAGEARKSFIDRLRLRTQSAVALAAAELIFGELVGNVVRHAPGPIDVQLDLAPKDPVLHVIDRGKGFVRDPALPSDPLSESGRGLYIIALLARHVQVERIPGYGNHVAVTLVL